MRRPDDRVLDVLVAIEVLGWIGPALWTEDDFFGAQPHLFTPGTPLEHIAEGSLAHAVLVPRFSTDLHTAWTQLVEPLLDRVPLELYWRPVVPDRRRGVWTVAVPGITAVQALSLPHALAMVAVHVARARRRARAGPAG